MAIDLTKFPRVNRDHPCPVCGKIDWCLAKPDGSEVFCQRVQSARRFGDAGWLHRDPNAAPVAYEPPKKTDPPNLTRLACELAQCLLGIDRLASDLGVSSESIRRLGVGWHHGHGTTSWPMRWAVDGPVHGIRYRGLDGSKFSYKGGREGLFIPSGLRRGEQLLVVTEGAWDCAAAMTMGLPAIARPSASVGHSLVVSAVNALSPQVVVVTADSERSGIGITESAKLSTLIASNTRARVRIWTAPPTDKDLRGWLRNGGNLTQFTRAIPT